MSRKREEHEEISRIFLSACELPGEEREAFVREAAQGDTELASEVLEMLAHDDAGALDTEPPRSITPAASADMSPPAEIGGYRILAQLGSGGMGVVYRARQRSPERDVALKVLRADVRTGTLGLRLEREARLLARLTHPGIARIFESGLTETPEGPRPFLVMELIEGRTITDHCDAERLDVAARVALFARVCQAAQHAHERGVIHRDLKPANVLVDIHGVPKVLDFGVGRTLDVEGEQGQLTLDGTLVGTLAYASPEQVRGGARSADERSDIYALGAILYELLAHRTPIEVKGLSISEAMGRIAAHEPTPLGALVPALDDLETIVHKALAKEPAMRYASANLLADDLERWARHEPVRARPPSTPYLVGRFVRRHRPLVATTAAILVALSAITLVSLRAARREATAARSAASALARAREVGELLQGAIEGADPFGQASWSGAETTLGEMLAGLTLRLERDPPEHAAVEIEARLALARSLKGLGDYAAGLDVLEAGASRLSELGTHEAELARGLRAETAIAHGRLGDWETAVAGLEQLLAEGGSDTRGRVTLLGDLVWALEGGERLEEAEASAREALELAREELGADEELIATLSTNLGKVLASRGDLQTAREHYLVAYRLFDHIYPLGHPTPAIAANNLGWLEKRLGNLDEAERLLRESIERFRAAHPGAHPLRADFENNLALVLFSLDRTEEALDPLAQALISYRETRGEEHADTVGAYRGLSIMLETLGRIEAPNEEKKGEEHRNRDLRLALASWYEEAGRLEEAARWRE